MLGAPQLPPAIRTLFHSVRDSLRHRFGGVTVNATAVIAVATLWHEIYRQKTYSVSLILTVSLCMYTRTHTTKKKSRRRNLMSCDFICCFTLFRCSLSASVADSRSVPQCNRSALVNSVHGSTSNGIHNIILAHDGTVVNSLIKMCT